VQFQQALLCRFVVQDGNPFQVHAPFGVVGEFPQGTGLLPAEAQGAQSLWGLHC